MEYSELLFSPFMACATRWVQSYSILGATEKKIYSMC